MQNNINVLHNHGWVYISINELINIYNILHNYNLCLLPEFATWSANCRSSIEPRKTKTDKWLLTAAAEAEKTESGEQALTLEFRIYNSLFQIV